MTTTWNTSHDGPGGLIAALPALFGFAPCDSLIVVTVSAGPPKRVGHVLRVDLDGLTPETLAGVRPLLKLAAAGEDAAEFVLILIEKDGDQPSRTALCAQVAELALPHGARLSAAFSAPSTVLGVPWRAVLGPRTQGVVGFSRSHPAWANVVTAAVLRGEVVARSREQLRACLKPNACDCVSVRRASRRLLRMRHDGLQWDDRIAIAAEQEMLEMIRQPQRAATLGPEQAARFAVALGARTVRDRLIGETVRAAATGEAEGAELLWSRLVPMLPDVSRAEAAVLLALAWYARGKGSTARVALETALAAAPGHELAQLLEACLFAGVRPEALQVLAQWP